MRATSTALQFVFALADPGDEHPAVADRRLWIPGAIISPPVRQPQTCFARPRRTAEDRSHRLPDAVIYREQDRSFTLAPVLDTPPTPLVTVDTNLHVLWPRPWVETCCAEPQLVGAVKRADIERVVDLQTAPLDGLPSFRPIKQFMSGPCGVHSTRVGRVDSPSCSTRSPFIRACP